MTSVSKPRAAISWSGGKDSCAALQRAAAACDVVSMVTMFDEEGRRSRSHGLRPEVLLAQAERLGLQTVWRRCSWSTYDAAFSSALDTLAAEGVSHVIFGDILFEEHLRWAEDMCGRHGLTAVEPLWGSSTETLFDEWTSSAAEAVIVTARTAFFDHSWLGRPLTKDMREDFARLGVDPCGELGEYHTVVTNSPLFSRPMPICHRGHVQRSGCWALDFEIGDAAGL
jgi:diphthine-ammonia ligase